MSAKTVDNIMAVQRAHLCTMCGTCYAVCPKDNLEAYRTWSGELKYRVRDESQCAGCGLCARVCPGAHLDLPALNEATFGQVPDDLMTGVVRAVYLTRATDPAVHLEGSSGGTLSALTRYLLEQHAVDGVLTCRMGHGGDALEPEPFIARTVDDLADTAGSIYQRVAANGALRGQLKGDVKLACVGLGCHIRGLRKAAQHLPAFRDKIALTLGVFCGHNTDRFATEHLVRRAGARPRDAARVRYRKGPHPGAFSVETKDGRERAIPFRKFTYFLTLFENHRCGLCTDPLNALCDLSVGDGWVAEKTRAGGWNATIVRSERGEDFLRRAIADGAIAAQEIDVQAMADTQSLVLYRRQRCGEARARILRKLGFALPDEPGLTRPPPGRRDYVQGLKLLLMQWAYRGRIRRRLLEPLVPLLLWMDERSMRSKNAAAGRDEAWLHQFDDEEGKSAEPQMDTDGDTSAK